MFFHLLLWLLGCKARRIQMRAKSCIWITNLFIAKMQEIWIFVHCVHAEKHSKNELCDKYWAVFNFFFSVFFLSIIFERKWMLNAQFIALHIQNESKHENSFINSIKSTSFVAPYRYVETTALYKKRSHLLFQHTQNAIRCFQFINWKKSSNTANIERKICNFL